MRASRHFAFWPNVCSGEARTIMPHRLLTTLALLIATVRLRGYAFPLFPEPRVDAVRSAMPAAAPDDLRPLPLSAIDHLAIVELKGSAGDLISLHLLSNTDAWRIDLAKAVVEAGGRLGTQTDPGSALLHRVPRDIA